VRITVSDQLVERRQSNFTIATSRGRLHTGAVTNVSMIPDGVQTSMLTVAGVVYIDVSYNFVSLVPITVYRNGIPLPNGPILIDIIQRTCSSGEAATSDGNCVCATGNVQMRNGCTPLKDLAPAITFGVLGFCILIGIVFYIRCERRRVSKWHIAVSSMQDDSTYTPTRGSGAKVKRIKFKGTFVMLKTFNRLVKSGQSSKDPLGTSTNKHAGEPKSILSPLERYFSLHDGIHHRWLIAWW
jgi:hypothetical protein